MHVCETRVVCFAWICRSPDYSDGDSEIRMLAIYTTCWNLMPGFFRLSCEAVELSASSWFWWLPVLWERVMSLYRLCVCICIRLLYSQIDYTFLDRVSWLGMHLVYAEKIQLLNLARRKGGTCAAEGVAQALGLSVLWLSLKQDRWGVQEVVRESMLLASAQLGSSMYGIFLSHLPFF